MKLAEEALKESESKYRGLFENLHEMVVLRRYVYDEKGEVIDRVVIDANPAALEALGVGSIDDIRGKGDREFYRTKLSADLLDVARRLRYGEAHHRGGAPLRERSRLRRHILPHGQGPHHHH